MTASEEQVNEAMDAHIRDFLGSVLRRLEAIDMGHLPVAERVRGYVVRYDAHVRGGGPRRGTPLRLVKQ
jgi:hypothetical protein